MHLVLHAQFYGTPTGGQTGSLPVELLAPSEGFFIPARIFIEVIEFVNQLKDCCS